MWAETGEPWMIIIATGVMVLKLAVGNVTAFEANNLCVCQCELFVTLGKQLFNP